MNYRLYGKIARRIAKAEKMVRDARDMAQDLDGDVVSELDYLADGIRIVYELMDARKDNGDYHVD